MAIQQIQLRYLNRSLDKNNSTVVIFQKPAIPDWNSGFVAWRVIRNCGVGDYHPFTYSMLLNVSASDSDGNFMPRLAAYPGNLFEVAMSTSGHELDLADANGSDKADEVQVLNKLTQGAISASVYRDGKVLAVQPLFPPNEQAVFKFLPKIYCALVSNVEEGAVMDSATVMRDAVEIDLTDVASADIVLKGGGNDDNAKAFTFGKENVVGL